MHRQVLLVALLRSPAAYSAGGKGGCCYHSCLLCRGQDSQKSNNPTSLNAFLAAADTCSNLQGPSAASTCFTTPQSLPNLVGAATGVQRGTAPKLVTAAELRHAVVGCQQRLQKGWPCFGRRDSCRDTKPLHLYMCRRIGWHQPQLEVCNALLICKHHTGAMQITVKWMAALQVTVHFARVLVPQVRQGGCLGQCGC